MPLTITVTGSLATLLQRLAERRQLEPSALVCRLLSAHLGALEDEDLLELLAHPDQEGLALPAQTEGGVWR